MTQNARPMTITVDRAPFIVAPLSVFGPLAGHAGVATIDRVNVKPKHTKVNLNRLMGGPAEKASSVCFYATALSAN